MPQRCSRALAADQGFFDSLPGTASPGTPIFANNAKRGGRLWSRRAACFLWHTFLSPPKEKHERPMGRLVLSRAVVGALFPAGGFYYGRFGAHRRKQGAFRSPPAPLWFVCRSNKQPHGLSILPPAIESPRRRPFLQRGFVPFRGNVYLMMFVPM